MSNPAVKPPSGEDEKSGLRRITRSSEIFAQIEDFLIDEAALLDSDLHQEWLELLTDDVQYTAPVRDTVHRRDGDGFSSTNFHFSDNKMTLGVRARRTTMSNAYDQDPAPRIRRIISNIQLYVGAEPNEYIVRSYIVVFRNRFDQPNFDALPARREDTLRRTEAGLKLAKRLIFVDQTSLGASYFNLFM